MLAQSQQLSSDQKPKPTSSIEYSSLKPPRHPQSDQIDQSRIQKQMGQKRYKNEEQEAKQNGKVSLPSLPGIKKQEIPNFEPQQKLINIANYGNGHRILSRLPKLDAKSDVPKQKHSSNGPQMRSPKQLDEESPMPHYSSVTPEKRQQYSPERQVLNKRRLMAKSWQGGLFASKTKAGCLPNKTLKTNQDAAILFPNNLEHYNCSLIAVCDGHGTNGHLVSNLIKQQLPKYIEQQFQQQGRDIERCLTFAFEKTNKEIIESEFDTTLSGSTAVAVLIRKEQLWTANVGDSRAIICRNQDGWKAIQLTRDHKPSDEQEKQRIIEAGGRIDSQRDFYGNQLGPERVWLQYIDAPGLAMTRSMGDKLGAQAGVISIPEILEYTITPQDQFIIVASDGVWEYLSNDEVMNVVVPYIEKDNIDLAADKLMAEAINAWKKHSLARDDITCIVVQLKNQN
ncbi:unnamed protein product [Paramecium primaurelia]|uniref:PPM-type phosphatase domain-containing protein n=1 Tax=Paramecium primaurelia TaxID=5886 RepID=A0A8S1K574_PARPR|nr:unnamed protein product [Paramecium primaurelia]